MIRPATRDDIPAIRALMQSVAGFWNPSWPEDVLDRGLRAAAGLAFVWADPGGQVLGFVCAHDTGFRGYVSELIVAPQAQNQGIGRRLLARVEQELASRGCPVVIVDAWKDALDFYRRAGWTEPQAVLLCRRLPVQ